MKSSAMSRIGSALSVPLGVVLVVFFFLPWLDLTCAGPARLSLRGEGDSEVKESKMGHASGMQLAAGRLTPYDDDKPVEDEKKIDEANETIQARPWFWVGLIVPLLLIALGVLGVMGKFGGPIGGGATVLLGVLGLIVVFTAMAVDYTDDFMDKGRQEEQEKLTKQGKSEAEITKALEDWDKQQQKQLDEGEEKGYGLKTHAKLWLWLTLLLYVLTVGAGLLSVLGGRAAAAPVPAAAAPPAAPAQPAPPLAPAAPAPPPAQGQANPPAQGT